MEVRNVLKYFAMTGAVALLQLSSAPADADTDPSANQYQQGGTDTASRSGTGSAAPDPERRDNRPLNGYSDSAPMYSPGQPVPGTEPSTSPNGQ